MALVLHRRQWLRGGLALAAAAALPGARACEFWAPHLRITHPWTRAAEAGAQGVLVCMKFDEVTQDDRLVAVITDVAERAETVLLGSRSPSSRGVDLPIPAGRETLLGETGMVLRLVGLRQALALGRTYPLRLVFERGGAVEAELNIDYGGLSRSIGDGAASPVPATVTAESPPVSSIATTPNRDGLGDPCGAGTPATPTPQEQHA